MPSQYWKPKGNVRHFFHAPTPADWFRIAAAIREGWNVMLCWDADRNRWRCDFIRRGQIASGDAATIGDAGDKAWAATEAELARTTREVRHAARDDG